MLKSRPEVEFAEVNAEVPLESVTPNDPVYPNQWSLSLISAPDAWSTTTGSPSVVVAILDTGVDAFHEDLAPNIVGGWNIYDDNSDTSDVYGHGTMVAGTVAAVSNNARGIASVAWQSRIMPVRIAGPSGSAYISDIASGLVWAADHGARVANISYMVTTSSAVTDAAEYFQSRGGVVTVSAGNYSTFDPSPDNPYILTVSATDQNDLPYSWSNSGNNVDLAAPGCVYVVLNGGRYGYSCGTSFSAPVVAGVAALVLAQNPGMTPAEVTSTLQQSADDLGNPGFDPVYGWGRVNAANALDASGGGDADTEAPSVSITSPSSGATVSGSVNVVATAADNVGVASVVFNVDGEFVCADSTPAPDYSCSWNTTGVGNGSYALIATATDDAGNSNTATITVNVDNDADLGDTEAPSVEITLVANNSTVDGTVTVQATASDNVGVVLVEFRVDDDLLCSDDTPTYSCSWNTTTFSDGPHTVTATATDAAGNSNTALTTVNVDNAEDPPPPDDTEAPFITITSPRDGSGILRWVTVEVMATDNVEVVRVELYVNGSRVDSSTSAPFTTKYKAEKGSQTLQVKAYDAAGNSAMSSPVTVRR